MMCSLSQEHIEHLATSGLSADLCHEAGLYTETSIERLRSTLGNPRAITAEQVPALVFPYFEPGASEAKFSRARPDRPRVTEIREGSKKGKREERKYEQPWKVPTCPYFPPRTRLQGRLRDASLPLFLTEGEKKALALDQLGLAVVGLSGIWNFTDGRSRRAPKEKPLHPWILEHVALQRRTVAIVFDGDGHHNEDIPKAAQRLAEKLIEAGASRVRLTMPPADGPKGIDDYFVSFGEKATRELLDGGIPYDPAKPWVQRKRRTAALTECEFQDGDHTELARRLFKDLNRQADELVFDEDKFWRYDEDRGIYAECHRSELQLKVMSYKGCLVANGEKGPRPLKINAGDVNGALALLQPLATQRGYFDEAPSGLAFRNGFLKVSPRGAELAPHAKEHRARFAYSFDYDTHACAPTFMKTLGEIFECEAPPSSVSDAFEASDAQMKVMLIQEQIGLALLGLGTRYQIALVFLGEGANGKSLLLQVLCAIFPPGSTSAIPPQEWGQEYRRALLAGKRLNACEELPEGSIIDAESFKAMISGSEITGREIRQSPFSFKPTAGHIFAANRLPASSDQTHGFWRRLAPITFDRVFAPHEQDPSLLERILENEIPGIVGWAVEGGRRALEQGHLTQPASSREALARWRMGSDPVREFIDEKIVVVPPDVGTWNRTPFGDVYAAYRTWCADSGYRPLAKNRFSERMRHAGIDTVKGAKGARFYWVRLLERGFGEEDDDLIELESVSPPNLSAGKEWIL